MKLVVTQPFGDFVKGDEITDPATIDTILSSENAGNVVKVAADPVPSE